MNRIPSTIEYAAASDAAKQMMYRAAMEAKAANSAAAMRSKLRREQAERDIEALRDARDRHTAGLPPLKPFNINDRNLHADDNFQELTDALREERRRRDALNRCKRRQAALGKPATSDTKTGPESTQTRHRAQSPTKGGQ